MPYEELKKSGRIIAGQFERSEVKELVLAAKRELKSARAILKVDATIAQDTGYSAMLKAGRALMFSRGWRPLGPGQHATVVFFCRESLKKSEGRLLDTFDRLRRDRHEHLYWGRQPATETEARGNIRIAAEFVKTVEELTSG